MGDVIARRAAAAGLDATVVAAELAGQLGNAPAALVLVFADWRLDVAALARELQRELGATPVVGCTTDRVIADPAITADPTAAAIALGGGMRAGVGVATELSKSALASSREAIMTAAAVLGELPEALDPARHVVLTMVDGTCGCEEAFCVGSAAPAPQLRVVGGAATVGAPGRAQVFANGVAIADAGLVIVLACPLPFRAITSHHLVPTPVRTVVTAATGRRIEQLDGRPAGARLRELLARVGLPFAERPVDFAFARYIAGVPYVRTVAFAGDAHLEMGGAVDTGHVLTLMRVGDLVGATRRDLRAAIDQLGGQISAFIAFSCIGRHWQAAHAKCETELAAAYAEHSVIGMTSVGEHHGMLWVNYTLTGLAIGEGAVEA